MLMDDAGKIFPDELRDCLKYGEKRKEEKDRRRLC